MPGFDAGSIAPSPRQRALVSTLPQEFEAAVREFGFDALAGGAGSELLAEHVLRPTCTINGLTADYQGDGPMTVIPCEASAKLDFRLVPGQQPREVVRALQAHLATRGFDERPAEPRGR